MCPRYGAWRAEGGENGALVEGVGRPRHRERQGRGTKKDGFISQGREASPSIYGRKGGV